VVSGTSAGYVLRRLAGAVPVVVGVTVLVFLLIHIIPGDPARTLLAQRATPELVANLHHRWGLDRSLPEQYWLFAKQLAHGDTGPSLVYDQTSRSLIVARIAPTAILLALAAILAALLAVPLAVLAATHRDGLADQLVRLVPLVGLAIPSFWLGTLLLIVFGLDLGWLPIGGYGSSWSSHLESLLLPALTLALGVLPLLVRSLRAGMLEVLDADYVATARAKGLPERRVLTRHVARTALIPAFNLLGVSVAFLVGGTIIVERVFALPGLGAFMLTEISDRDFPVVQGIVIVFALLVVLVNLITDLVTARLDPRIQL
jgi:peptide/nickel transport system permease protein